MQKNPKTVYALMLLDILLLKTMVNNVRYFIKKTRDCNVKIIKDYSEIITNILSSNLIISYLTYSELIDKMIKIQKNEEEKIKESSIYKNNIKVEGSAEKILNRRPHSKRMESILYFDLHQYIRKKPTRTSVDNDIAIKEIALQARWDRQN